MTRRRWFYAFEPPPGTWNTTGRPAVLHFRGAPAAYIRRRFWHHIQARHYWADDPYEVVTRANP